MIQPKIQEVWIPEKYLSTEFDINKSKTGIFFTPEEFETFKREFGSKLLEKAAENAELGYDKVLWDDPKEGDDAYMNIPKVDKESITSVLDEYLLNNKI